MFKYAFLGLALLAGCSTSNGQDSGATEAEIQATHNDRVYVGSYKATNPDGGEVARLMLHDDYTYAAEHIASLTDKGTWFVNGTTLPTLSMAPEGKEPLDMVVQIGTSAGDLSFWDGGHQLVLERETHIDPSTICGGCSNPWEPPLR